MRYSVEVLCLTLLVAAVVPNPALGAKEFDAKVDTRHYGGDRNQLNGEVAFHIEGPNYGLKPSVELPFQCSVASNRDIPEMGVEELDWTSLNATKDERDEDGVRKIMFYVPPRLELIPHFATWIEGFWGDEDPKRQASVSGPGFPRSFTIAVSKTEGDTYNAVCGHWAHSETGIYYYNIAEDEKVVTQLRIFTRPRPDYISPDADIKIDQVTLNVGNEVLVLGNGNDLTANPNIVVDRAGGKIVVDIESILKANEQI